MAVQQFVLAGFHGEVFAPQPVPLPCEGLECLQGDAVVVKQGSRCHSEFDLFNK
jgi:hypothetical protein